MLFMVIEKFKNGDAMPVYHRFREHGRMLPEGLQYVDSWIESGLARCFQLMECDDPQLIDQWRERWQDLKDLDVVSLIESQEVAELIATLL